LKTLAALATLPTSLFAPVFNLTKKYRELIKSAMNCLILPTFTKIASEPENVPLKNPSYTFVPSHPQAGPLNCPGHDVKLPHTSYFRQYPPCILAHFWLPLCCKSLYQE
jgi:hypothetical protein